MGMKYQTEEEKRKSINKSKSEYQKKRYANDPEFREKIRQKCKIRNELIKKALNEYREKNKRTN